MNQSKNLRSFISGEISLFYSLPAILWQILFLCVPFTIIIYFSFTQDATYLWQKFTLKQYTSVFNVIHLRVIARSLFLSISTAGTCLIIAYPVVYFLALKVSQRWKGLFLFFIVLPLWTNFLVQIYAWFFLLERSGLINKLLLSIGIIAKPLYLANNMFAVFVVMVYCYLPFMVMPLYSILEKLDKTVLEASYGLGATPWQTFVHITIPLSIPGIRTGVLLVMVPAFGEFVIPVLIGGSKYLTVGSLISFYFLTVSDNALGAAFTCISGTALFIVALLFYWLCQTPYAQPKRVREL